MQASWTSSRKIGSTVQQASAVQASVKNIHLGLEFACGAIGSHQVDSFLLEAVIEAVLAKVTSMKLSRSLIVPYSHNVLANCVNTSRRPSCCPPLFEQAMDGLVVGIALRREVPLSASVHHREHSFQDRSGRHRFLPKAAIREVLFKKVLSTPFPLVVMQTKHDWTSRTESLGANYLGTGSGASGR